MAHSTMDQSIITGWGRTRRRGSVDPLSVAAGALAIAAVVALGAGRAWACSLQGSSPHTLDPTEQAIDVQPPDTPVVSVLEIKRGRGPEQHGCSGSSASSCDDLGLVTLDVSAADDRTAAAMMGYRIVVARGTAPGLIPLPGDIRAGGGHLGFFWLDGASDDQEDLDYDLEVRAVDLAGNVSAGAALVKVRDDRGGCRIAGHSPRPATCALEVFLVALGAAGALIARRRAAGGVGQGW